MVAADIHPAGACAAPRPPAPRPAGTEPAAGAASRRVILVVDDSAAQRTLLTRLLRRWGYAVREAASGEEALALCRTVPVDMVLSDWMMPGMSGIDFCRAFRELPRSGYGYFILLTSKTDKGAVARGLQEGADDFLSKPVSPEELQARLTAGERILRMERELQEKNRLVTDTLDQLQKAHAVLGRDLEQARHLQQSLVREGERRFGPACVSLLLRPSGHVGGDLVGCFPIGRRRVGLFAIDVSGHGVTAALLAARLAGLFSGASPEQNIALMPAEAAPGTVSAADGAAALPFARGGPPGAFLGRPPTDVAAALNRLMLEEVATDHYCTLAYAEVDLDNGRVRLVQAGHPHPLIQRASGRIDRIGEGGLPVGLIPCARYTGTNATLRPGDRLLIMSDGFTECTDPGGQELGEDGLARLLVGLGQRSGQQRLQGLLDALTRHAGGSDFADDVSAVLLEFDCRAPDR